LGAIIARFATAGIMRLDELHRIRWEATGEQALLFLKKKKQKDFVYLGLGRWRRHSL